MEETKADDVQEVAEAACAEVEEVVVAAAELRQLQKERDEYLALSRRLQADFENFQKRMKRETAQQSTRACARLLTDLLPIVDNFERALQAARTSEDAGSLVEGVTMIHGELMRYLEQQRVEVLDPSGKPFDPRLHEGMAYLPSEDIPEGTVVDVFEKGYRYQETLLRPARVTVSAGPPAAAKPEASESD